MYENKRSEKSYVCPFSAFSCLSSFGFSVEIVISFYDLCVHIYIYIDENDVKTFLAEFCCYLIGEKT